MKRHYKKKPHEQLSIAKERITELFRQAKLCYKEHPERADRYVEMARNIAMRFKVKLASSQKRQFCKHCYCYLVPSVNCRVRLREGKMTYYCLKCKKFMRIPYK